MQSSTLSAFEDALSGLECTVSRTGVESFPDALDAAIEPPAVGAPLPFEDLSLSGTDVTLDPTPAELRAAETGVTAAGCGIAEYGTVVVQSRPGGDEPISLFPTRQVAVLRADDVVPDVAAALDWFDGEFRAGRDSAVFVTGPSATADMGGLVHGAHGPKEVHVVLVEP